MKGTNFSPSGFQGCKISQTSLIIVFIFFKTNKNYNIIYKKKIKTDMKNTKIQTVLLFTTVVGLFQKIKNVLQVLTYPNAKGGQQ